ncbi:MAG: hypothetical protein IPK05_19315 [Comamonadaceae bacterium]|nr:hypothetical protein [Comamonadaceae bacterium]
MKQLSWRRTRRFQRVEPTLILSTEGYCADIAALERHDYAVRAKWKEARQASQELSPQALYNPRLHPACGSGNFLYVTLEHLKRLEGEVLKQPDALGDRRDVIGAGGETVTLQQLLGIEVKRAQRLWLNWSCGLVPAMAYPTSGNASVAEPVVHDYGNIEHRDGAGLRQSRAHAGFSRQRRDAGMA